MQIHTLATALDTASFGVPLPVDSCLERNVDATPLREQRDETVVAMSFVLGPNRSDLGSS